MPPVPEGPFDVVLLLETLLAFADKEPLLGGVAAALRVGGRFALTVEEGEPLTAAERERMPDADTVWLVPLAELRSSLERVGLRVRWQQECSRVPPGDGRGAPRRSSPSGRPSPRLSGSRALEELVAAHRLWSDWLAEGGSASSPSWRSGSAETRHAPLTPSSSPSALLEHVRPSTASTRLAAPRRRSAAATVAIDRTASCD